MTNIQTRDDLCKPDTPQAKSALGIIVRCQRMTGTWADVCAMTRNGCGVVRDGPDVRLIWSEAYEQWCLQ